MMIPKSAVLPGCYQKATCSTTLSVVILFEEGIEYQAELLEITAMAADKLGGVGEITLTMNSCND